MDLIQPKSPVLRPYQREALEASKRRLDAGVTRQLIALPTGTGKTIVFANLLRSHSIDKKMLVLVHRMELAEQAWSKLKQCNPGVRVGVEMGWRESCRADRIVIAGIQTIGRDSTGRILNFPRDEFGAIVCDEAHHAIAGTYMRVFDHFRIFDPDNRTLLLGVTATPVRGDGRGLSSVFEEIVFNMPILEAIRSGWLCDLRAFRVRTQVDLDRVRAPLNGDFIETELDTAVNTRLRNELVVKTWCEYGQPRQTIVFCVTIQHGQALAAAFNVAGVRADCVWGTDPDRSIKISKHKAGEIAVLTNCGVLTEGYDDWRIGCVLLARPTKSELLFMQMIGRGTRIDAGISNLVTARLENLPIAKQDCIVIDVVDNSKLHRLVTMATIVGYGPDDDLRGESVARVGRTVLNNVADTPRLIATESVGTVTTVVEEIDLFAPKWKDGLLNRSVLQWFRRGNSFVLPLPGMEDICIEYSTAWAAHGTVHGQRFGKEGFGSFAEALAYGEAMFGYLGKPLLDRIRDEEHLASITPIQEDLLRSAGERSWSSSLTKDEAARHIALAYQRELDAGCVSPLPLQGDGAIADGPVSELESPNTQRTPQAYFPKRWKKDVLNDCALHWYRTDDGGYAMPLPDFGELVLRPKGTEWLKSGEICGERLVVERHISLVNAFGSIERSMDLSGGDILAAVIAEQHWDSEDTTPLQAALLTNLVGARRARAVESRLEAQQLIESLYLSEYDPAEIIADESNEDYAEHLNARFHLDLTAVRTAIDQEHDFDSDS